MIKLAKIFQSGMVLQRLKPIRIWGNSDCEQHVTVRLNDEPLLVNRQINGAFELELPPQQAMMDATLSIEGIFDRIILTNVDIGEVWIAGGQSNMEFGLRNDHEAEEQISSAQDEHLRFYDVGKYCFGGEEADGFTDGRFWDRWLPFNSENAGCFSAVGLYFAKQLREQYQVPVAIVGCNWGGTSAVSWLEESFLEADPNIAGYLNDYRSSIAKMDLQKFKHKNYNARKKLAKSGLMVRGAQTIDRVPNLLESVKIILSIPMLVLITKASPFSPNRPCGLYHTMLKQITGYACRGVIWYQGESDDAKAKLYGTLFSAMIQCWRDAWKERLPFLFVQLAPFGRWMGLDGSRFPEIRSQQEWVSKNVPDAYMTCIMDVGMEKDIHPKNKRPVGERLALLARGKVYGEDILCEPPEFIGAVVQNGQVDLKFKNCGNGLSVQGAYLNAMKISVNRHLLKRIAFTIHDTLLSIHADTIKVDAEIKIEFAQTGYCEVNLYNSAMIPANPFSWQIYS